MILKFNDTRQLSHKFLSSCAQSLLTTQKCSLELHFTVSTKNAPNVWSVLHNEILQTLLHMFLPCFCFLYSRPEHCSTPTLIPLPIIYQRTDNFLPSFSHISAPDGLVREIGGVGEQTSPNRPSGALKLLVDVKRLSPSPLEI